MQSFSTSFGVDIILINTFVTREKTFQSSHADFFPLTEKIKTVSQSVKAWKMVKALDFQVLVSKQSCVQQRNVGSCQYHRLIKVRMQVA